MTWFVYLLRCCDSSLYTGITPDPHLRTKIHNLGKGSKYVATRLPVKLVYFEKHADRSLASKREYEIKKLTKFQKEQLIKDEF